MGLTRPGGRGWLVAGAISLAVLVGGAVLGVLGPPRELSAELAWVPTSTVAFLPLGVFLLRHRPADPLSWLMWWTGLTGAVSFSSWLASGWLVGAWLAQWTWILPWAALPAILLRFPDADPPRWRRTAAWTSAAVGTATAVALAVGATASPHSFLAQASAATDVTRQAARVALLGSGLIIVLTVLALVSLAARTIRARGHHRWQYACLAPAAVLTPLAIVLSIAGVDEAGILVMLALPLGITVAMLHQWSDLDVTVNRAVIRAIVLTLLFTLLLGIMFLAGPVVAHRPWPQVVLVTGIAFLLAEPLRRLFTGWTERWLYGARGEPYRVLRELSSRMQDAGNPIDTLRSAVRTLAATLRVPYAAMDLRIDGDDVRILDEGRPLVSARAFELRDGTEVLGTLLVSPRREGEQFNRTERELIEEVTRQAAVVAQTHRLTLDLQRSRERLVVAREEERLRLRDDLHDGLGPILAGVRMQLGAAAGSDDPTRTRALIDDATTDLAGAGRTVRELIEGLRPAALDEGLGQALVDVARAVLPEQVETRLTVAGDERPLPAAVEVAAFRIGGEAITNIGRHAADATRCSIDLNYGDSLRLTVADNSPGEAAPTDSGVGLTSMQHRAEELGGWLTLDNDGSGTAVTVVLPIAALPL